MLRYWTHWRRSLDLRDDLLAKSLNRFQSKPRVHPRPVHHEPHELGAKFFVIGHHLLNHFGGASDSRKPPEGDETNRPGLMQTPPQQRSLNQNTCALDRSPVRRYSSRVSEKG